MGSEEMTILQQVFANNWIAPVGPELDHFEEDLSTYLGVENIVALNSATASIHLALNVLGVGQGDLVFVQTLNHVGSVNPIMYQGATPVFIDSEKDSWNMSPEHLESAVKASLEGRIKGFEHHKPKAIIPVHLYGMPANMSAILEIANRYDLAVIEDAAESLGSKYGVRYTGTLGTLGVYSFNGNKIITTSGGGALASGNAEMISKAKFLATQARDNAPHYQHSEVGYNYRLSNVLAGIGRGQMQVLPDRISQRRANFERYKKYFSGWNDKGFSIDFQEEEDGKFSNRWLSCILVDPSKNKGLTRENIRQALEAENIEARPLWKPMHLQPVFNSYPFFGDGTSDFYFDIGLCLPSGSNLSDHDFSRIFSVLDQVFSEY